jgi:hypothetical protein
VFTPLNALVSFALGAFGWLVFHFIGQPVRHFFDIRREIKRLMVIYWDFPIPLHTVEDLSESEEQQRREARLKFSELGAQLIAFDKSEAPAAWLVRRMGFDPMQAGRVLHEISVEFGTITEDRYRSFPRVDVPLKFKTNKQQVFYDPRN